MRRPDVLALAALVAALSSSVAALGADEPRERLAFDECARRAVERHPTVATALGEVERADALVRQARAAAFPTLIGTGVYTRLDGDRVLGDRVIAGANQLSANVALGVPLLAPQAWAGWSRAGDQAGVAKVALDDARRALVVAVGRAYVAALAQHRAVEVAERAAKTAEAHRDFASQRFSGGVGNRLDVVRAEQQAATARAQLESARVGLGKSQEALGVLAAAEGPVDVADEPAWSAPGDVASAIREASSGRADLRALSERNRAADRSVDLAYADYLPSLLGVFQPFYQSPATLTQPTTGWQAQLLLTVPFYDGGLRGGRSDERVALAAEARAALEGALRQMRADVRAAFEAMRRADVARDEARRAATLANEALELATKAYAAGATTNLEVIDAEQRARDADSSAIVSEDAARQARLDLLVAVGRDPAKKR